MLRTVQLVFEKVISYCNALLNLKKLKMSEASLKVLFAFVAPRLHLLFSYVSEHNNVSLLLLLLVRVAEECTYHFARLVLHVDLVFNIANHVRRDLRVVVVRKSTRFNLRFRSLLLLLFRVSLEFVKSA